MIQILPTTASGLSHSAYSINLKPRGEPPNLKKERLQRATTTLSGETVVSSWAKKVSGTEFSITAVLTDSEYDILRLIDEHATVFYWVIILQGRSFNASVDITKAFPVNGRSTRDWEVSIKFTIISELHGR